MTQRFSTDNEIEIAKEAPAFAPLGRIAFGEKRIDVPFEKDTAIERDLFKAIEAHLKGSKRLDEKSVALIQHMMKKGYYTKLLKQPVHKEVFRGIGLNSQQLLKLLKQEKSTIDEGVKFYDFLWKPRINASTSFSLLYEQALLFAADPQETYAVILHAKVIENPYSFLDLNQGIYAIDDFSAYDDEAEVIAMGPIKGYKITWELNRSAKRKVYDLPINSRA
jgi:hypothetical protein